MGRIIWTYRRWKAAGRGCVGTSNAHFLGGDLRQLSCVIEVNIYLTRPQPLLPVICGTQTDTERKVHRHKQMKHSLAFVAGKRKRQTRPSYLKSLSRRVSEGRIGGVALWCSTFSFARHRFSELGWVEECVSLLPSLTRRDDSVQELRHDEPLIRGR